MGQQTRPERPLSPRGKACETPRVPNSVKRRLALGALLFFLIALAYARVWRAGFLWDDDAHLTRNVCIVGPGGFREIWTTAEATYYPLVLTTFWVVHKIAGLNPLAYHLLNVALHGLSALALWRVLRVLEVRGAWLGAALWGLHPVMVQSVAWITEMKNTQSCLFYLLAVWFFLEWRRVCASERVGWRLWLSVFFAALAIASKTSTVVLPAVLALCLWWQNRRPHAHEILALVPFIALSGAASLWTIWEQKFHSGAVGAEWAQSFSERLAIAGRDVPFYLGKLVWPHPLIFIYPRWTIPAPPTAYLGLGGVLFALAVLWFRRRSALRPVLFAFGYFLLALLPVLGFFNVYFFRYAFVSDHFQYLASIGPLALAGAAIDRVGERASSACRLILRVACGALLFSLAALTWRQSGNYADAETLWAATLAQNPGCWMAHYERARAMRERGDLDDAIAEDQRGLAIWPDYASAHYNLGSAFLAKGDTRGAIAEYEIALRLDPHDAETHNNLANVLAAAGRRVEALTHYETALKIRPEFADAEFNYAGTLDASGRADEAREHFRKAAALAPRDAEMQLRVGHAFQVLGPPATGVHFYEATLALAPDHVSALANLAWMLATSEDDSLRDPARAAQLANRAGELTGGNDPVVLHALAAALAEKGEFARALEVVARGLALAQQQGDDAVLEFLRADETRYREGQPMRSRPR